MDYLRRSVSLRAYGQRDPLIEYRREGLSRYRALETAIKEAVCRTVPNIAPADYARIRTEEEKTRARLVAQGSEEGSAQAPLVKTSAYGRNDVVIIKKGEETQTLKYKKAERLVEEDGWIVIGNPQA